MERKRLLGELAARSRYEAGGVNSVKTIIKDLAAPIEARVKAGWPREQAEAYMLIAASINAPLAAAVRERSDRYAASTHAVCEALEAAARRQKEVAPLVFRNLTGEYGFATDDAAWEVLRQPGAKAGLAVVTSGVVRGSAPAAKIFPDDQGFRVLVNTGGKNTFKLVDSDVVCIRSAPKDAGGHHSLVHIGGRAYAMPPLATVTLEK
eukprot:1788018-Prymnesium_polylepis.1